MSTPPIDPDQTPAFDGTNPHGDGPLTTAFKNQTNLSGNRAARRAAKKARIQIGPEAIRHETAQRIEDAERKKRVRELPNEVKNILEKITQPERLARTKDIPLHKWTRTDTLDLFATLALVHSKMLQPVPNDEGDDTPPPIQLVAAEGSLSIFYPMTKENLSHLAITVNDPRHYLSAAERDLVNDEAVDSLNGLAEKLVMGLYSLATSLTPGSDAHEIAELMGMINEMNADEVESDS